MKKIFFAVLMAMVVGFVFVGCSGDGGNHPDVMEISSAGVLTVRGYADQLKYMVGDDFSWCPEDGVELNDYVEAVTVDRENDVITVDLQYFADHGVVDPGVIRLNFVHFNGAWFNIERLPMDVQKKFVKETWRASEFGVGDLVLVILYENGVFTPMPNEDDQFGRSAKIRRVISRHPERTNCYEPAPADNDGDGYTVDIDCNDADANIYPGAIEICDNGIDDDCDGTICVNPDPGDVDADGDGFTPNQGDCNDANANIYPGAIEICGNGIDEDCDGTMCVNPDPNDIDADGDGWTENQGDCNDADATVYPGAIEICGDGIDQDCSGADLLCGPDPEPMPCVSAYYDAERKVLRLENISAGFSVFDPAAGNFYNPAVVQMIVLGDFNGWGYDDGIDVKDVGVDVVEIGLSMVCFPTGDTRINLAVKVGEEWFWFITARFCEEDYLSLSRTTNSPSCLGNNDEVIYVGRSGYTAAEFAVCR